MSRPTLRRGDKNSTVKELQNLLNDKTSHTLVADGDFGRKTEDAVKDFQKANRLGADGIVGKNTWKALDGAADSPAASPTSTSRGVTAPSGGGNYASQTSWDPRYTDKRIKTLYPDLIEKAMEFVIRLEKEKGIKIRVTSAFRTYEEQNEIYAEGRTITGKSIKTNAKGGQSYHNFGLAIDVVEISGSSALYSNPNWETIGAFGESIGWEWGGRWTGLVDKPHFQFTYGHKTSALAKANSGTAKTGASIKLP